MKSSSRSDLGVVVIGRNEGTRLARCLESVSQEGCQIVYVDSGSTDGSPDMARSMKIEVVELEPSVPFTAARARNAGMQQLLCNPSIAYIQFVDGDCEVVEDWLDEGSAFLRSRAEVGVVGGRRRERYPEASIYNRLCDMEWDTPIGEAAACHGDAMMKVEALRLVGGFNGELIAGEEPELCVRLRQSGWKVFCVDADMTLHDAAMSRFGQWWRRAVRAGHAYAEGAWLHGRSPQRHNVKEVRSIAAWGLALPILSVGLAWATYGTSLMLLAAYGALFHRIKRHRIHHGDPSDRARLYARYCVIGKFAEAVGMIQYIWRRRMLGRPGELIEYKDVPGSSGSGGRSSKELNGHQKATAPGH